VKRSARIAVVSGRVCLLGLGACVAATVGLQFEGIVAKNVAVASELAQSRADIDALRAREAHQVRTIRRLSDAHGAIPEIHDKLRLVGPREEIIYVRGLPAPTAQPDDDWNAGR